MADEQIIKALECCTKDCVKDCDYCPYDIKETETYCANDLIKDALDLINRQKAEIERLNGELVDRGLLPTITLYDYNTKQIRSEAIAQYCDEVKKRCVKGGIFPAFVNRQMEDVRKEMVGE